MTEPILKVKNSVAIKIVLTLLSLPLQFTLMSGAFGGADFSPFFYFFLMPFGLLLMVFSKIPKYSWAFIPIVLILSCFLTYAYLTALCWIFRKIKANGFRSFHNK